MLIIHHEDRQYMMSTTGTICATNPSTRSTQIVTCVRDVCSSTCGLNVRLVSSSSRLSVSGLKFPCNGLLLWAIPNQLESTKKTFMKRLCVSVGVPNYVGVSFSSIGFWSLRLNFDPRQPSSESMRFLWPREHNLRRSRCRAAGVGPAVDSRHPEERGQTTCEAAILAERI